MIRALTKVEDLIHTLLIQRPSYLSLTSTRSKNRARGKNSPASIHIPMAIMMLLGPGVGQEREARDDEREPTGDVEDPPILPRFAPFATLAVDVVTGLEAVARLHTTAWSSPHLSMR